MNYVVYHIQVDGEVSKDLLAHQLGELNILGLEEFELGIKVYLESGVDLQIDLEGVLKRENLAFERKEVPEQNWNQLWESNFQPVFIDGRIQVRASFHAPKPEFQFDILIDPKMSFGTGHHETTQMMMQSMLELDFNQKEAFDFGAGTGILSVLAEKMGAKKIVAIDNDDWCMRSIEENITLNACSAIEYYKSDSPEIGKTYDIILANINKNVLIEHAQRLSNLTQLNGFLILSGLLSSDYEEIASVYANYWSKVLAKKSINNWISITYTNKITR